jgi:gas vesicle protein
LLFAPKAGAETREDLTGRIKDLKGKTEDWIAEQKAKRAAKVASDEVGA